MNVLVFQKDWRKIGIVVIFFINMAAYGKRSIVPHLVKGTVYHSSSKVNQARIESKIDADAGWSSNKLVYNKQYTVYVYILHNVLR